MLQTNTPPKSSILDSPSKFRWKIDGGGLAKVRQTLDDPKDYDDRPGYQTEFLGVDVPLPKLTSSLASDVVPRSDGKGNVLDYWNFSVIQSASRRMPFFSAVNVNGEEYIKTSRSNDWHYDPRIDKKYQLLTECYGDERKGFFSRGHMTRREDPVWGDDALQAEKDTFHATNAVPQMQSHNGGLWLSLEDYVLRNAAKDKQRACVITGPVLTDKDPIIHGVKIPVLLWKIVAFIHDETQDLAAVAYLSSQASFLPDVGAGSFVWGQFKKLQVPVARIAKETKLDFGPLLAADVLSGADGSFAMAIEKEEDLLLV